MAQQAKTKKRTATATGKSITPRSKAAVHDAPARQQRPASATQQPVGSAAKPAAISKADLRTQVEKLERANAKLKVDAKEHGRTVKGLERQTEQLRRELEAARAAEAAAVKTLDRLKARDKARRAEEKAAQAESSGVPAAPDTVEDGSGESGRVRDEDRMGDERESAAVD